MGAMFLLWKNGSPEKDCIQYQEWLKKKENKPKRLNDKGLDGKTTRPSPQKLKLMVYQKGRLGGERGAISKGRV
ncbi:hypothetical protein DPMN_167903 [Dreissena polymorpha]|uniref:Uncharacterized protein n=1 Tax=Dreissena polymorpha TaxID=45954 RepID=A0A9D4F441_DREPO|nr:hypothetical protein DPMN_167903 [Dreissena polymorpha]